MRKLILAISLIFFALTLKSQDIHFSQFNASPMNLNPGLAGQFDGDYRLVANHRNQWRSVTRPYNTTGGSADARQPLDIKNLGAGASIYTDKAGDSQLSTLQLNLAVSYLKHLSRDSLHSVSVGLQTGLTHRKINYSDLEFDEQYQNGIYNPNASTGEAFARDSRTYLNLNLGAAWYWKIENRKQISAGVALHNINRPKQSFYNDPEIKLDMRWTLHANAEWPVTEKIDVIPSVLFMYQGPHRELTLGTLGRYRIKDFPGIYRAVFLGWHGRTRDAGFLTAGLEYDNWRVGVSYDFNFSQLSAASNARGGFEISAIYIFRSEKQRRIIHKICPDFL